jgi:hypothetical protein
LLSRKQSSFPAITQARDKEFLGDLFADVFVFYSSIKEEIMKSAMIYEPLTKLQCCPTSDGGTAAVLVSQSFLDARPWVKS